MPSSARRTDCSIETPPSCRSLFIVLLLTMQGPACSGHRPSPTRTPTPATYRPANEFEQRGMRDPAAQQHQNASDLAQPNALALIGAGENLLTLGRRAEAQRLFDRGLA